MCLVGKKCNNNKIITIMVIFQILQITLHRNEWIFKGQILEMFKVNTSIQTIKGHITNILQIIILMEDIPLTTLMDHLLNITLLLITHLIIILFSVVIWISLLHIIQIIHIIKIIQIWTIIWITTQIWTIVITPMLIKEVRLGIL